MALGGWAGLRGWGGGSEKEFYITLLSYVI
jgi:hypothetical protein